MLQQHYWIQRSRDYQKISELDSVICCQPYSFKCLFFFFMCLLPSFLFFFFFIFPLGFSLFLWPWQESLAAVFQHPQAGSGKEGQPSYIRNHRFMAFTRSWGVNADQMENTPARALQLLALPHARAQSLILIVRPKGNSVCSPNALQLSRWSSISFLKFPSWSIVCK